MFALIWVLMEADTRPAQFDGAGYARSKPEKITTSNIAMGRA